MLMRLSSTQYHIRNLTHTTIAVRDILPGEELTVTYVSIRLPRKERRERLHYSWGFECTCPHCLLSEEDSDKSDARLAEIEALQEKLDSPRSVGVRPEDGEKLVQMYRDEKLDIYLGQALARAALNYALFGQEDKARQYGAEAAEAVQREWGPAAGDLPSMRVLAKNPREHWAWERRLMN
jgi:hypothetical protein